MTRRLLLVLALTLATLGLDTRSHAQNGFAVGADMGGTANGFVSPLPFSPSQRTGVLFWLRADAANIPGATNGATFANWLDRGPNAFTFSQPTAADQFSWNASDATFNNQPSVTSIAVASMTTTTTLTQAQPYTLYAIFVTTSPSLQQFIFRSPGTPHSAGLVTNQYFYTGGTEINFGTTDTSPHIWCIVMNGASSASYLDSSATPASSGNAGTQGFTAELVRIGLSGALGLVGRYTELLGVAGGDSSTQRGQIFAYAGARYGKAWQ